MNITNTDEIGFIKPRANLQPSSPARSTCELHRTPHFFLPHHFHTCVRMIPCAARCSQQQIWTVSKDWETAWDGWKTGLFTDLDVEEMETAAGTFTKKVWNKYVCEQQWRTNNVSGSSKTQQEEHERAQGTVCPGYGSDFPRDPPP